MGSMIRGYDTSALFREDTLLRIQALRDEIATSLMFMQELKEEVAASEERVQRLKREVGITDPPNKEVDSPEDE